MSFGKYKDKAVAWVLFTHPNYFSWMQRNGMTSKKEYQFMLELVKRFNAKPIIKARCSGTCKGANTPTRLSLYKGIFNMELWFCDECDPYSQGAILGTLSTVSRFEELLGHRQEEALIKAFCRAKGVPERKTKKFLKDFFNY